MHHATPFLLSALDRVQEGFLEALDLDEEDAFTDHNLAPLRLRRDIAMLGFLRRFAHRRVPECLAALFRFGQAAALPRRRQPPCHGFQIFDPIDGTQSRALERSVYGLIYTFNSLPAAVVEDPDTSGFQRKLQHAAKKCLSNAKVSWKLLMTEGILKLSLQEFHAVFNV